MFSAFDAHYVKKTSDGNKLVLLISRIRFLDDDSIPCGVDPYYLTSQNAHNNAKKLVKDILSLGYNAVKANDVYLKQIAAEMGAAHIGMNTLCVIDGFGSFFEMEAILTDMPIDESIGIQKHFSALCTNCKKCLLSCPTGAITEKGFIKNNCLRNHMLSGREVPTEFRSKMNDSLIGCTVCRDVCPSNDSVKMRGLQLPHDFKDAFSLEDMLCIEGTSVWQKRREELLGKNLVRRERLCAQAIIIAANKKRSDLLPLIEKLVNHKNTVIANHALWAINELKRMD